jgi:undecaprenyl-diphosphatase
MRIVGAQCAIASRRPWRALCCATNRLGNGWLYLLMSGTLLIVGSRQAYGVILHGGLAVAAAHAVYPWIKRRIGRLRPFERMPHGRAGIPVLDRYSFPSGHCMTATAVAIPLTQAYPHLLWGVVAAGAAIAWARVACAHHYPSDLVAGCALGATGALASTELLARLVGL